MSRRRGGRRGGRGREGSGGRAQDTATAAVRSPEGRRALGRGGGKGVRGPKAPARVAGRRRERGRCRPASVAAGSPGSPHGRASRRLGRVGRGRVAVTDKRSQASLFDGRGCCSRVELCPGSPPPGREGGREGSGSPKSCALTGRKAAMRGGRWQRGGGLLYCTLLSLFVRASSRWSCECRCARLVAGSLLKTSKVFFLKYINNATIHQN